MIDAIEREIVVPVPRERVWAALTRPEYMAQWFAAAVEMDFWVGGELALRWQDGQRTRGIILSIDPPRRFSFRWDLKNTKPGEALVVGNSTVVTFQLEEVPDGTSVRVLEAGFAALPAAIREQAYQENDHGWQAELVDLADYFADQVAG